MPLLLIALVTSSFLLLLAMPLLLLEMPLSLIALVTSSFLLLLAMHLLLIALVTMLSCYY